nr:DUF2568 domain-containing protein [Gordonia humi]
MWGLATLVFVSELLMLAVLGGATWQIAGRGVIGLVAAAAAVVIAVALWAWFASPQAVVDSAVAKALVKIGLYSLAAGLLAVAGARPGLVWGFAVFSLIVNLAALAPPYRDFQE